ncbi:type III secretion system export apparatus subunit SctV [Nitratireductor sp. ZSWI3]|uniref:type III secretion system export apparatus subunit SctV n=1 Tax=Nitratireductor sp. ZSWI3 TaxID=2966359 RepID=UPI00214FFE13|nr:type III secretion system export apparatus subunit SctV [Nitratireductor sp. ZSWI3]MCR4264824.1 type III secretion system export apparatus subunit SctV [Nitratireductor sp. ZSWI3]
MFDRLLPFLVKVGRRSDLVIAMLMLVSVVMMLIPLPTELVDVLISANIAISVLILLACFYVRHPLDFSSLPSVILIATLFRLAITITTTRLILLQADAGNIVTTFGSFVVGGSIAVGLVIFLIITIAQFVVIAKGAERVAEVAARFTLDALPGKQMSIDAELRNGDIDQDEARHMRRQLERESQLFGAMDGAMKFVKGDVIAGIVIILVNLIGGFAVGTLQHGMSLGEAAATYSLLTVGDGLVSQIPALLIAVASGAMITRVAGTEGHTDLGGQIAGQLLRDARALALASVVLLGLSLVPGFPTIVFLILGAVLGAGAYALRRNTRDETDAGRTVTLGREEAGNDTTALLASDSTAMLPPTPIVARFGSDLGKSFTPAELQQRTERIRTELLDDLGITVPRIDLKTDDSSGASHLRLDLEGAPILDAEIPAGSVLYEGDVAHLELLKVPFHETRSINARHPASWVDDEHVAKLVEAGLAHLSPVEVAARWITDALRLYADHFVGIQETRHLLTELEGDYADLVREAQEAVPLQKIAEVLRRLVAENIPIRNPRIILEAIANGGRKEQDTALLAEQVRVSLKRQISFRMADRNRIIAAYLLQPSAEAALRSSVQSLPTGATLNLSDPECQAIAGQIKKALSDTAAAARPVVLAAMDVRRHLRSLLVHNGIELPVISYQELAPEFNVQPLATITGRQGERGRQAPRSLPAQDKTEQGAAR